MDNRQETRLMYLVGYTREHPEYLEEIRYILDNYPEELNKQLTAGWTAIMISIIKLEYYSTRETIELLLKYNPDLTKHTRYHEYNNIFDCVFCIIDYNLVLDIIILLLKYNADINSLDKHGRTILMNCIKHFRSDIIVEYILEHTNIDLDIKSNKNRTAYDYAIKYNLEKYAELIKKYQNDKLRVKCALD